MTTQRQMKLIVKDLSGRDEKLKQIIDSNPLCTIGSNQRKITNFEALVNTVISQQLAVKAAESIFNRVKDLADGPITPSVMATISEFKMRKIGVSGSKYKAIQGLTDAALTQRVDINRLHEVADEKIIFDRLTELWGIGPWTVDMFMMFQLGKLDVWPITDLGVRRGWEKMYSLKKELTVNDLEKKGEKFRPYRSVVAWYCWRALN